MRTILSAAISLDGYLDDCFPQRLKLSGTEDWENVTAMRSRCDAILVGAGTVRADNPSLVIKDDGFKSIRAAAGMQPELTKVTVTRSGNLSLSCDFFTRGNGRKIVFTTTGTPVEQIERLRQASQVFIEEEITPAVITGRLAEAGCMTLMVEGGSSVLGMFLRDGNIDLLRLALAPFFVGDDNAPRFTSKGSYPWDKNHRLALRSVEAMGDTSVMWMAPTGIVTSDREYLRRAVNVSRQSPPCDTAYRVGAVIVTADGKVFEGYTHETGPADHAEEAAVSKAEAAGCSLAGAVIYSSMEPCTHRKSKPLSCSDLIVSKGFSKAVYALAEPSKLAFCEGHARLKAAGLEVVREADFDSEVLQINAHILGEK